MAATKSSAESAVRLANDDGPCQGPAAFGKQGDAKIMLRDASSVSQPVLGQADQAHLNLVFRRLGQV